MPPFEDKYNNANIVKFNPRSSKDAIKKKIFLLHLACYQNI